MNQKQKQTVSDAEKKRTQNILKVLIPITIAVIVLAVITGITANKAGNKKTASSDKFIEIAYQQGCKLADIKEQLDKKEIFENALVAQLDDENNIYFFNFKEKMDAKSYFASVARGFKDEVKKGGADNSEQENLENYCYYTAVANGKYMHIVRVKNTVVYADVSENHSDTVKRIIAAIGY